MLSENCESEGCEELDENYEIEYAVSQKTPLITDSPMMRGFFYLPDDSKNAFSLRTSLNTPNF